MEQTKGTRRAWGGRHGGRMNITGPGTLVKPTAAQLAKHNAVKFLPAVASNINRARERS